MPGRFFFAVDETLYSALFFLAFLFDVIFIMAPDVLTARSNGWLISLIVVRVYFFVLVANPEGSVIVTHLL